MRRLCGYVCVAELACVSISFRKMYQQRTVFILQHFGRTWPEIDPCPVDIEYSTIENERFAIECALRNAPVILPHFNLPVVLHHPD